MGGAGAARVDFPPHPDWAADGVAPAQELPTPQQAETESRVGPRKSDGVDFFAAQMAPY